MAALAFSGSMAALGKALFLSAGIGALGLLLWFALRRQRGRETGLAEVVALAGAALWSLAQALSPVDPSGLGGPIVALAEIVRDWAMLALVYRLFARHGRDALIGPVLTVLAALALGEGLQVPLLALRWYDQHGGGSAMLPIDLSLVLRLLLASGGLVLLHNLYVGLSLGAGPIAQRPKRQGATGLLCLALAVMWGSDLNAWTVLYLAHAGADQVMVLRGLGQLVAIGLIARGGWREGAVRLSPSRTVAFQSLTLLAIGLYLMLMVGAAQSLAWLGEGTATLVRIGFAAAAVGTILVVVPSGRLQRWLNVVLTKHLFEHRYDYRAEWLRLMRTIGQGGDSRDGPREPLQVRVVRALADITDSARGLLLVPDDEGELVLEARWQWETIEVPPVAMSAQAASWIEASGFIVDLDAVRAGVDHRGEGAQMPRWLVAEDDIWVLVPLVHFDRLVGVVALGRPAFARELDWEDLDLLRVGGQQLASYLAEHAGQRALSEASRFDEFNRRMAFVMHDVRNLASQLALLARNAERHADNPEFRKDMLVTLRSAADKLNALIARLSRYRQGQDPKFDPLGRVDLGALARSLVARVNAALGRDQVTCLVEGQGDGAMPVLARPEALDQLLGHLVQNAIDATVDGAPIRVEVFGPDEQGLVALAVEDRGCGMSAEFVRHRLFEPFASTKPGGFGIGAFEARELARAMGGRLEVASREGHGSRFVVRLPQALAEARAISVSAHPDSHA